MGNLALLVVCFLAGITLRRAGGAPVAFQASLNHVILRISLPALILRRIPGLDFGAGLIWLALMPWFVFALSWLFFSTLRRVFDPGDGAFAALVLLGGLGNTSFVGLPMIETWFGADQLATGLWIDQAGTFLALSLVGLPFAELKGGGAVGYAALAKKLFIFPPFLATIAALAVGRFIPESLLPALDRLGDTLTPLAMVSVGFALNFRAAGAHWRLLPLGLGFKMALAPAAVWTVWRFFGDYPQPEFAVMVFEAAMPPMITAGIVATQKGLAPDLVNLMLGVGIPLGFLTLPLCVWLVT